MNNFLYLFFVFWTFLGFTFALWAIYKVKVKLFLNGLIWIILGAVGWTSIITAYFLRNKKPSPFLILLFNILFWIVILIVLVFL